MSLFAQVYSREVESWASQKIIFAVLLRAQHSFDGFGL